MKNFPLTTLRTLMFIWVITLMILTTALFLPSSLLSQNNPSWGWHLLYVKIRDRLIAKEEALDKLNKLEISIREFYLKKSEKESNERLYFPLKKYSIHSIGGKGGSGYQEKGYDFFDGNDHQGHPGHDIFIRDKNQDGLDDLTGHSVEVVSASPGIVVSVNSDWQPSSLLRGGNYIWVYDPIKIRYYYYAHLNEIFVRVGQIASRGDRLGTLGRTGVRAYPKKSPTHLHFVVHESINGYPKPVNPYEELLQTR